MEGLLGDRPFRSPHHTTSDAALVGGGSIPRPGEVSLAHNGVLFLDELPEFRRNVLEALRQPLEERSVTIARSRGTLRLPARFQLLAAMNPCPCGLRGHAACACTPRAVRTYQGRISGPLLDRVDIQVEVAPVTYEEMMGPPGETSAAVATRVAEARRRQADRLSRTAVTLNADLSPRILRQVAPADAGGAELLRHAMERFGLSARGHDRVLRVARTLADLEGAASVSTRHVGEALQFRGHPAPPG
jgi:magnesium chelatase family protein